jgi:hypothetical protein
MMVADVTGAVARLLRGHPRRRRDPLTPKRSDRQKFVRAVDLTERQMQEIAQQHRAEAERDRAPFPRRHIGADGVPRP